MPLRGGHRERVARTAKSQCPTEGEGQAGPPWAAFGGPRGPGAWTKTKAREEKERVEEGNERHRSRFKRAQAGPFLRADTRCRRREACSAPLKAMATVSVVQHGIIFWVPADPCPGRHQWL